MKTRRYNKDHRYANTQKIYKRDRITTHTKQYLWILFSHSADRSSLCESFHIIKIMTERVLITIQSFLSIMHHLVESTCEKRYINDEEREKEISKKNYLNASKCFHLHYLV
jgi:hypothetical protein